MSITARLFDAERPDRTLELDRALRRRIGERQLLWVDVEGNVDEAAFATIARRMRLSTQTRHALAEASPRSFISLHGSYFHLRLATLAPGEADHEPRSLDLIAAKGIVLSSHSEPVEVLRHLEERIEADARVGAIDGPAFVRSVMDAAITGYFLAVDSIVDAIDDLDGRVLKPDVGDDGLARLVAIRRRIAQLRRTLADQREVFGALGAPDFMTAIQDGDGGDFRALGDRFVTVLSALDGSRDLLIGSFDIFMTRTAQRTNEIMKTLTLATVLLLPGALIAGLLGMNVQVPLDKDSPLSFWLVLVAVAAISAMVLVAARIRRWV